MNISLIVNTFIFLFAIVSNSMVAQQSPTIGNGIAKDKKRIGISSRKSGNDNPADVIQIDYQNKEFKVSGVIQSVVPIEEIQQIFGSTIVVAVELTLIEDVTHQIYYYSTLTNFFLLEPIKSCIQCESSPDVFSYRWNASMAYGDDQKLSELNCLGFERFSFKVHASQELYQPNGTLESIPTSPEHFDCNSTQSIWPNDCFEYVMPGVLFQGRFSCKTSESDLTVYKGQHTMNLLKHSRIRQLNNKHNPIAVQSYQGQFYIKPTVDEIESLTVVNIFGQVLFSCSESSCENDLNATVRLPTGNYFFAIKLKGKPPIIEPVRIF